VRFLLFLYVCFLNTRVATRYLRFTSDEILLALHKLHVSFAANGFDRLASACLLVSVNRHDTGGLKTRVASCALPLQTAFAESPSFVAKLEFNGVTVGHLHGTLQVVRVLLSRSILFYCVLL
jgi:hypothetical protein